MATFKEEQHPRWPQGAGDKAGEFMPKGTVPDAPGIGDAHVSQDLDTISKAERATNKAQKPWRAKLKAADKAAIGAYQSGEGYPVINGALREGQMPEGTIDFASPALGAKSVDATQAVTKLDAALQKVPPLKEPAHVWRGIGPDALAEILGSVETNQDLIGTTLTDDGYASVSVDPTLAERFVDEGGAMFHIQAPKGAKVADLGAVNPQGGSDMVFPRGSSFRITGTRMEAGQRIIDAELVPEAA